MTSSVNRETTRTDINLRGERNECELCEETKRCFDRFGIIACRTCHTDFLPGKSLL